MTTNTASLLPPNATPLERAIERGGARISDVAMPVAQLWNPETCPAAILPWLAWGVSVDRWDPEWSEATKRAAVAASIDLHRKKGTPASIDAILARYDSLARLVEWHEAAPRRTPHTFDIVIPLLLEDGTVRGGAATRAAVADAIVREVMQVKPLREHFRVVQQLKAQAAIGLVAGATFALFARVEARAVLPGEAWDAFLQDEDGAVMQDEENNYLEIA